MNQKKQARRFGLAFAAFLLTVVLMQFVMGMLIPSVAPGLETRSWYPFLISALPNYLFGMPVFLFLTRKLPDAKPAGKERYTLSQVMKYVVIGIGTSYLFAILGDVLNRPFVDGLGVDENLLEELILNADLVSTVVFVVFLAPVMEELLFRKRFLDKALQFGKTNAVFTGGIAFGLFHLNIPQFVYASALGVFWGMVYVRHRSFLLVVVLHMITNAVGSLFMPWIAYRVSGGETIGGAFILVMMALGLVFLFTERKAFYRAMQDPPEQGKKPSLLWNAGFLVYFLLAAGIFLLAALGAQTLMEQTASGIIKVGEVSQMIAC